MAAGSPHRPAPNPYTAEPKDDRYEPPHPHPHSSRRALGNGRSKLNELMQDGVLEAVHIGACRRIVRIGDARFSERTNHGRGNWFEESE